MCTRNAALLWKLTLSVIAALVLVTLALYGMPAQGKSLPPTQQSLAPARYFTAGDTPPPVVAGLPERPKRDYPLPYHRPGQPARTSVANARHLAESYGLTQPLTLTRALELGVVDDPFQGNYTLVDWDHMLIVAPSAGSELLVQHVQAAEIVTSSPRLSTPVVVDVDSDKTAAPTYGTGAVVADLNGDGWDESIAVYLVPYSSTVSLSVGEFGSEVGRLTSAPAVAYWTEGGADRLLAAARGYDGGLWTWEYADGAWGTAQPLGGNLASAATVAGGTDAADIFYLDAGGTLGCIDAVAGTWQDLGTPPGVTLTLDPAAARLGTRTDVFVRGADNALWHRSREGTTWSAWESLGGFLTSSPAAVWQSGRLDVVARGYDGGLWHRIYRSGAWEAWESVGGELASAPAIASNGGGALNVLALNAAGELMHLGYTGSWGTWQNLGGELDSAPAAAWRPGGHLHVLARSDDVLWQLTFSGGAWGAWAEVGGLPRATVTVLPQRQGGYLHHRDQAAGHFMGDGREQVLVWSGEVIGLYQAAPTGGFVMEVVDDVDVWPIPLDGQGQQLAVGDLDGNGREEFALLVLAGGTYYVNVYGFDVITQRIVWVNQASLGPGPWGEVPASLAAGDLNGDGRDDLIVGYQMTNDSMMPRYLRAVVWTLNESSQLEEKGSVGQVCSELQRCAWTVGAGNFDGIGPDEVALGFSTGAASGGATLQLSARVATVSADLMTLALGSPWSASYSTFESLPDVHPYLHAADLDRNLRDEIVWQFRDSNQSDLNILWVDQVWKPHALLADWLTYGPYGGWVGTAFGNLTGQGLRVGPPTVRYQNDVKGIEAIISEPPKHKDVLGGVLYDINAGDEGTYSEYVQESALGREISIQAQRDWTLDAEGSATIGNEDGTHVTASLGGSYGDHFEKTAGAFETLEMQTTQRATSSDLIVYTRSSYQVWEYPLYQNDPTQPSAHIAVVFQQGNNGLETASEWGSACDFWYRPNHQNHNVWSYPANDAGFANLDPARGTIFCANYSFGDGSTLFEVAWQAGQTEQLASEVTWDIRAGLEAQVGGDSIMGFEIPGSVNFSVNGSYGETKTELQSMSATETTRVGGNLNSLAPPYAVSASYQVRPCLYWSRDGYLVLDWAAVPGAGDFWANNYGAPDPAFIHLYEEGECSVLGTDFSTDVFVNPSRVVPGDVVTATAIVRNFSAQSAANLRLRFYSGDPDDGGVRIEPQTCVGAGLFDGDCRIGSLPGRARQEVSAVFTAEGAGEQRIYAVLDPLEALAEVHEENNKAYGRLQIAAATYADPGAVPNVPPALGVDRSYETFVYTDTQGTETAAIVPLVALSELTRVELRPVLSPPAAPPGMMSANHSFDLLAFQGAEGSGWVEPVSLSFGGTDTPPALLIVHYTDADWQPGSETGLALQRWTGFAWEDAVCDGMAGQVVQSVDDNWLLVPVCETGSYALLAPYAPRNVVYLPLVLSGQVP